MSLTPLTQRVSPKQQTDLFIVVDTLAQLLPPSRARIAGGLPSSPPRTHIIAHIQMAATTGMASSSSHSQVELRRVEVWVAWGLSVVMIGKHPQVRDNQARSSARTHNETRC
jgi:hypothetical protein